MLLTLVSLCFAQVEDIYQPPETILTFSGLHFYSRSLESKDKKESIHQWVLPLFFTSQITESVNIRIYQTISGARLKGGPDLNGLENTRIRGNFSFFENALMTYLALSLPVASVEPKQETVYLDSLLYKEVLQFGVGRLTEGFDLETGVVYTKAFGKLSFGIGTGYASRGDYDRLSQSGSLVKYNPGDLLNFIAGLSFHSKTASLSGRTVYIHYTDDKMGEDYTFKSGDELLFAGSARFRFEPLTLALFLADTIKGDSEYPQDIIIGNTFNNRLNGGFSLAFPLFEEALIPRIQADGKIYSNDGETDAKVYSFGIGCQLLFSDRLKMDIFLSLMSGNMDAGEVDISGFNLGATISYGLPF